jgi:hypothetical protein
VRATVVTTFIALSLLLAPATATAAAPTLEQTRARAVAWAVKQVGTKDPGKTNCTVVINRWVRQMGLRVPPCRPWCGAFVHQAFLRGGLRLSARLIDPAKSYRDAVAGRRGLRRIPVGRVRRGDLLFYAFQAGKVASHLAIARERPRGGRIATVEGNVDNHVSLERRGVRYVALAARVVR